MGDRNNPIKFGPEWLRNLARARRAGSSGNNSQNHAELSDMGVPGAVASNAGATSTSSTTSNTANSPKVQLAKLRYGREEMLALYDRTAEAPPELKYIDILYQPRGKPPVALSNTFEDDMRESMRAGPLIGSMPPGERFGGIGRGVCRGINILDPGRGGGGRGSRGPFVRSQISGRGTTAGGWHLTPQRMPTYNVATDEETTPPLRSWNTSNGLNVHSSSPRSSGDQAEWASNKMFRNKRQGTNTNWRQSTRDEEEWRQSDTNRARSQQQWDRDWGDRPTQDKQPGSSNRRGWSGDTQNDDNLPEWAVDNSDAPHGGTFDASGAFHGYSNDDTNLPKTQESAYALTRSHTHGSFTRSRTSDPESSEEWWASEKAKKLSPKRFDASDLKFKKQIIPDLPGTSSPKTHNRDEKSVEKSDGAAGNYESQDNASAEDSFAKKSVRFAESKTFDAMMRSDINLDEPTDERSNFQSVMITPNNSLRQKHQNIVAASAKNQKRKILHILQNSSTNPSYDSEPTKLSAEEEMIDDLIDLSLEDKDMRANLPSGNAGSMANASSSVCQMSPAMSTVVNSMSQMPNSSMQHQIASPIHTNPHVMNQGMPGVGMGGAPMNVSMVLQMGQTNSGMGQSMIPIPGMPGMQQGVMPNQGMNNPNIGTQNVQPGPMGMPNFPSGSNLPGMANANVKASLFMGSNLNQNNNNPMQSTTDIPMPNHGNQNNMFPVHGMQHSGNQAPFNVSMYSNIVQQPPAPPATNAQNLADQWYYEDPDKNIQGPFMSKEMFNWYRAGFFSPSLMVRRACDAGMRPLGSYGPVVPFAQVDMLSSFPFESRNQGPHETLLNTQQGLGLDVMSGINEPGMDAMQFGTVGIMRNSSFGQQQMDSLWSQPTPSQDVMWMQQAMNSRNENRVNNLPLFFWDQPSAIASNSLLPEEIAKEMKTEDQILAQLRASQNINLQNIPLPRDPPPSIPPPPKDDDFPHKVGMAPTLEGLQKFISEEARKESKVDAPTESQENKLKTKPDHTAEAIKIQQPQSKPAFESKIAKQQAKIETEKSVKNKENNVTKTKSKKVKEEKKEEDSKAKEEENKTEATLKKRNEEVSPTKGKKEDKVSKKELEKEKKEWIKEGFTIVKGSEKNVNKDMKKLKAEEIKAAEEAERKKKEEERAAEEEKKRKQIEAQRKQQEVQQRQIAESAMKKAPWSVAASQAMHATNKDGLTLAEIQRLEREKKLEQMKEQQQMMQIIAQQQAAALAREQEMQAGLGWAKKKGPSAGQNLAEIQAETRKQAAAAAAAAAATQALEEAQAAPPPQINHAPWGNNQNGGGFWDPQPTPAPKQQEQPKVVEPPKMAAKKKPVVNIPLKKETSPAAEFETWCTTVLASWSSKIDVPTFVGFLKDIESPYEVKDYVKCYLGESKDSSDFSRQFLERRSKLLRVGMVTPSDDLCSPAMAVNPRTTSGSDYQEVKGKGKKSKKNKMLKVDARNILGFSVTAAEDRINVGDIDTV